LNAEKRDLRAQRTQEKETNAEEKERARAEEESLRIMGGIDSP